MEHAVLYLSLMHTGYTLSYTDVYIPVLVACCDTLCTWFGEQCMSAMDTAELRAVHVSYHHHTYAIDTVRSYSAEKTVPLRIGYAMIDTVIG